MFSFLSSIFIAFLTVNSSHRARLRFIELVTTFPWAKASLFDRQGRAENF